ncbi:Surfeit locus protein 2 [Perkinsus olseni]|uniref:Surfeit locus protein 2 n=2 Tax=Perkinsus olseni TaxID=32597 RepID=A0A7J6QAJ5_PEROL|nr:Surfeit locus protein 2 [Perkinsus olseni]
MPGATEDSRLTELVEGHADLAFNEEKTKIKCISTGHEMPLTYQIVHEYINRPKYLKARQLVEEGISVNDEVEQYKNYLIQHDRYPHCYFCVVTHKRVNKDADSVHKHISGKKFQYKLKAYKEKQESKKAATKSKPAGKEESAEEGDLSMEEMDAMFGGESDDEENEVVEEEEEVSDGGGEEEEEEGDAWSSGLTAASVRLRIVDCCFQAP